MFAIFVFSLSSLLVLKLLLLFKTPLFVTAVGAALLTTVYGAWLTAVTMCLKGVHWGLVGLKLVDAMFWSRVRDIAGVIGVTASSLDFLFEGESLLSRMWQQYDAVMELLRNEVDMINQWITPTEVPWWDSRCFFTNPPHEPHSLSLFVAMQFGEAESYVCVWYRDHMDVLVSIFLMLNALICLIITAMLIRHGARYAWYVYDLSTRDPIGRPWVSWFINLLVRTTGFTFVSANRSSFTACVVVKPKEQNNHSHGMAAGFRNAASATSRCVAAYLGLNPYMVQQSRTDVRQGLRGCRSVWWGKDTNVPSSPWNPQVDDLPIFVDCDYYMDMPDTLARFPMSMLVSTFTPRDVARMGTNSNYGFCFNKENEVRYGVSGGAEYNHPVWNYGTDILSVSCRIWGGLVVRIVSYTVDMKPIDLDHSLVFLNPINSFSFPLFDLSFLAAGTRLKRLVVNHGDHSVMAIREPTGTLAYSIGLAGHEHAARLTSKQYSALTNHVSLNAVAIQPYDVSKIIGNSEICDTNVIATYFRSMPSMDIDRTLSIPVESSVEHYTYLKTGGGDGEEKTMMQGFMQPLIASSFVPTRSAGNDLAAVRGRIVEVRPDPCELSSTYARHIDEFARLLIPDEIAHSCVPKDVSEVYERQNRPMQRRLLDQARAFDPQDEGDQEVETFLKAEAYTDIKHPRIITTIPPKTKLEYSRFVYSFSDILRSTKWYAFGKTPLQIARRVAEVCSEATHVVSTDMSRFDGRVSVNLRYLERVVLIRAFRSEHRAQLIELMDSQMFRNARTKTGLKYETGAARLSGSPETADFNSLDNAFMAYSALRFSNVDGIERTPEECYAMLGVYGGDDGLTRDVNVDTYVKTVAGWGQKLTLEVYQRGARKVNFLARFYSPSVWHGCLDSMCDIVRQLSKFHMTTNLPGGVSEVTKLLEKSTGYYLMDKNTPIIGQLVSRVIALNGGNLAVLKYGIASYHARYEQNTQYPNQDTSNWMEGYVSDDLPSFDRAKFNKWLLEETPDLESVLKAPLCVEHDPRAKAANWSVGMRRGRVDPDAKGLTLVPSLIPKIGLSDRRLRRQAWAENHPKEAQPIPETPAVKKQAEQRKERPARPLSPVVAFSHGPSSSSRDKAPQASASASASRGVPLPPPPPASVLAQAVGAQLAARLIVAPDAVGTGLQ